MDSVLTSGPGADEDTALLRSHLYRNVRCQGDRTALVHQGRRWSFAEIADDVKGLSSALISAGVGPGDVVSYQLPNCPEAILIVLALLDIGAVANPIVPIYRSREVGFILGQAKPKVIFTPGTYRGFDHEPMFGSLASPDCRIVVVAPQSRPGHETFETFRRSGGNADGIVPSPDEDALLLYTSGTEGDPKGVRHSQRGLITEARSVITATEVNACDVLFMASPLTHITGFMYGSILSMVLGGRLCLTDGWDADTAANLIRDEGCTWTVGATPFLQGLLDERLAGRIGTLKTFRCGGADVPPKLIRDAQARGMRALRTYGCSEHPTISGSVSDDPSKAAITDGRVHPHNQVRIVDIDDETNVLPAGEVGEIQSKGPEVFLGYRDSRLDARAFTPDGWLRTGDIGRLDDENYITVVGRKKDIIIRKGENLSAKEIEDVLIEMEGIAAVAVIGVPDPVRGEMMVAVCVPADGARFSLADLTRHLEGRGLARQKFPERLEVVAALPMNPAGKVRKVDLRRLFSPQIVS